MTAVQLLRRARGPIEVTLFERSSTLGPGVAYGTDVAGHLLNVPAAKMSALPDVPDHFFQWVVKNSDTLRPWLTAAGYSGDVDGGAFLPRLVYGVYLKSLLETTIAEAGIHMLRVREGVDVAGIAIVDGRPALALSTGEIVDVDVVVLAVGNLPPSDPPVEDPSFYKTDLYRDRPWGRGALEGLRPDDSVLLIGTGLTMIDLATTLLDRGFWGRIHAVSRRGRLPNGHGSYPPGLYSMDAASIPGNLRGLVKWFRRECKLALERGSDWRAVFDAFRPYTQSTWSGFSVVEKRRFLRHVRGFWEVCRHRVPPAVRMRLSEAVESGQLTVSPGRIVRYEWVGDTVEVIVSDSRNKGEHVVSVQRVINCTGPTSNYRKMSDPLMNALFDLGVAAPDELHLGFATDEAGRLIGRDGRSTSWLFTLGPTRKGSLWETTAVPEIRVQARDLAGEILREIED